MHDNGNDLVAVVVLHVFLFVHTPEAMHQHDAEDSTNLVQVINCIADNAIAVANATCAPPAHCCLSCAGCTFCKVFLPADVVTGHADNNTMLPPSLLCHAHQSLFDRFNIFAVLHNFIVNDNWLLAISSLVIRQDVSATVLSPAR